MRYNLTRGKYSANGLHIGVHFGIKEQSYKVKFSKECLYDSLSWENDWNKLCGWSYGLLPVKWEFGFSSSPDFKLFGVPYVWAHHYNSIRVCWRSTNDGRIELCTYIYENGIRTVTTAVIAFEVEKDNYITVVNDSVRAYFYPTNDSDEKVGIDFNTKPKWGYRLYPVFGGNDPSPHDMNIELERI